MTKFHFTGKEYHKATFTYLSARVSVIDLVPKDTFLECPPICVEPEYYVSNIVRKDSGYVMILKESYKNKTFFKQLCLKMV